MRELAEMVRTSRRLDRLRLTGAVVLTVGIVLIDTRQAEWGAFWRFVVAAVPCGLLYAIALSVMRPGERLETWQNTLMICGLGLLLLTLIELADVLGAGGGNPSSGTGFWVTGLITCAAVAVAIQLRSPVHMLIGALFGIVAFLFFVDWTTDDLSLNTTRDLLLCFTIAYAMAAYALRRAWPDQDRLHADYLVLVAGIAGIIAGTLGAGSVGGAAASFFTGGDFELKSPDGWEFLLLAVSVLLIYYTVWQEYRATAYLGVYGLASFLTIAARGDGIGGWPLILVIVGGLALGAGLAGKQLGVDKPAGPGSPPPAPPTGPPAPPTGPPGSAPPPQP